MQLKKLFYIPGLISLIGLPILIFIFHPEDKAWETVVKLNIPSDDTINRRAFSIIGLDSLISGKKIEQINLSDDMNAYVLDGLGSYLSARKQQFLINEIERIQFTYDTSTVLKISLGEENTYGQFVYIVNLAHIYRIERYAYAGDDFYFFTNHPPVTFTTTEPLTFKTIDLGLPTYQPPSKWDILKWEMEAKLNVLVYYIKQNPILCIAFVVLIFIPFLINIAGGKIKKHFKLSF